MKKKSELGRILLHTDLGRGSWGKVLAVRWQIGELDRNFITWKL